MKKLSVFLAVMILATGFVFAQEEGDLEEQAPKKERQIELFHLQLSIGFPIHWTNGLHNDEFYQQINLDTADIMMEDKTVTANTAIGLSLIFNFTKIVGLTLDMDFFYGAKLSGFASPTSDHISLFGANIFLGPIFYIFNNDLLRIPIGIGVHMYYFGDDLWMTELSGNNGAWVRRTEFQFGPAISLGVEFHFTRNIYIFSKTNIAIDLVRMHSMKWHNGAGEYFDESHMDLFTAVNWKVKPSLGLGIKF